MVARALLVLAALLVAGCASPDEAKSPLAVASPVAMDWSVGNWWAYEARVQNVSFDIALIVHEQHEDSFRLGTNLSAGFFGLPWSGNVTLDRNPRIGPDVWPLFDFPLADGKEWRYRMLGYDAKTVAHEATIHVPGVGPVPGFRLEATAYGQTFARYNYVPHTGWFTRLALIEPTDGSTVLEAELTAFGADWSAAYYVEEPVREIRIDYPALPGARPIDIPEGFLQLRVTLTAQSAAGPVSAELLDGKGRTLATAGVLLKGTDVERATARPRGAATWSLEHAGAGAGAIHVEITGLSATGPLAAPAAPPTLDLAALLQSTRPANPHAGHVTSTGLPVGV